MLKFDATFLVFLISYILFIPLLSLTLWSPIRRIKQAREEDLDEELASAAHSEKKTRAIISEINSQMLSFRQKERISLDEALSGFHAHQKEEEIKLRRELEEFKRVEITQLNQDKVNFEGQLEGLAQESASLIINHILAGNRARAFTNS